MHLLPSLAAHLALPCNVVDMYVVRLEPEAFCCRKKLTEVI